jgi:hypothetical protein
MSIYEMYYYFFYKIYNFFKDITPVNRGKKYQAVSAIISFELFFIFSLFNYHDVLFWQYTETTFFSYAVLIPLAIIIFINWFLFSRNDDWIKYIEKFDNYSIDKNRKGGWIVFVIIVFIVANFIISCTLFMPLRPEK